MIDQWIQKLPRGLFATIAIALGIGLILLFNPLHTACDSQKRLLKEDLDPLFFTKPNPKLPDTKPPPIYVKYKERCLSSYTQGACLAWFDSLNSLNRKLNNIPTQCQAEALKLPEISSAISESVEIIIRMAWGAEPPDSYYLRNAWLDSYHIAVFCEMKSWLIEKKGKSWWGEFREDLLNKLPGAEALGREEAWRRSVFSNRCEP